MISWQRANPSAMIGPASTATKAANCVLRPFDSSRSVSGKVLDIEVEELAELMDIERLIMLKLLVKLFSGELTKLLLDPVLEGFAAMDIEVVMD